MQAISDRTMMMPQDIMDTLKQLNLLSYWKGQHFIAAPAKVVEDYWKMYNAPGARICVGVGVLSFGGGVQRRCRGCDVATEGLHVATRLPRAHQLILLPVAEQCLGPVGRATPVVGPAAGLS